MSKDKFNGPVYFAKFLLLAFAIYMLMFYYWYTKGGPQRSEKNNMFIGPNKTLDGWEYSNEFSK